MIRTVTVALLGLEAPRWLRLTVPVWTSSATYARRTLSFSSPSLQKSSGPTRLPPRPPPRHVRFVHPSRSERRLRNGRIAAAPVRPAMRRSHRQTKRQPGSGLRRHLVEPLHAHSRPTVLAPIRRAGQTGGLSQSPRSKRARLGRTTTALRLSRLLRPRCAFATAAVVRARHSSHTKQSPVASTTGSACSRRRGRLLLAWRTNRAVSGRPDGRSDRLGDRPRRSLFRASPAREATDAGHRDVAIGIASSSASPR